MMTCVAIGGDGWDDWSDVVGDCEIGCGLRRRNRCCLLATIAEDAPKSLRFEELIEALSVGR